MTHVDHLLIRAILYGSTAVMIKLARTLMESLLGPGTGGVRGANQTGGKRTVMGGMPGAEKSWNRAAFAELAPVQLEAPGSSC
jgi:hypothetical protein